MDKETLSQYGWVVVVIIVLIIMIALASPFGNFISQAAKAGTLAFGNAVKEKFDGANIAYDAPIWAGDKAPNPEYDNTFLMSHAVDGKIYAPKAAGQKTSFNSNSAMTSFTPFDVEGYDKLCIQNSNSVERTRVISFLDADENVIVQYSTLGSENQPYNTDECFYSALTNGVSIFDVKIPEGTKYAAFTVNTSRLAGLKVYLSKGEGFWPLPIETHGHLESFTNSSTSLPEIKCVSSSWSGKKVVTLGDSITSGYGLTGTQMPWSAQTASMLNMDFVNYGIGGSEIAQYTPGNNQYNPMCIRYAEMDDDADLVIVAGGTNDWAHNGTDLGVMGDTSINTFYGALETLCSGLKAKYPNAKIVFMTPIKRAPGGTIGDYRNNNAKGFNLEAICTAIKEVCAKYNIDVLDMFNISSLDPTDDNIQATYFQTGDRTHPNYAGATNMATDVIAYLKTVS